MTNGRRLGIGILASTLISGWIVSASATELPIPAAHKFPAAATAKKPVKRGVFRVASAEPVLEHASRIFPLLLGVAY